MNSQLELLLKIQAVEIKAAEIDGEKKKLPIRKQIADIVADVNKMKEMYSRTEAAVLQIEQKYEELKKTTVSCEKKLESVKKKLDEINDESSLEDVEKLLSSVSSARQSAEKNSSELAKLKQQLEKASKMAADIADKITQCKQSYDQLKPEYDKLVADIDARVNTEKEKATELAKGVDEALLKRYNNAKAKCNRPPLFKVTGDGCRCCNMEISNVVKKKVAQDLFAECENCGALLYIEQ